MLVEKILTITEKNMHLITGQWYWLCQGRECWPEACYKYNEDTLEFSSTNLPPVRCLSQRISHISNAVVVDTTAGVRHAVVALPRGRYAVEKDRYDVQDIALQMRRNTWFHVLHTCNKHKCTKSVFTVLSEHIGRFTIAYEDGQAELWLTQGNRSNVPAAVVGAGILIGVTMLFIVKKKRRAPLLDHSMEQLKSSGVVM